MIRLLPLLFLLTACVNVRYSRESVDEPLPYGAVAALPKGATLGECLDALGPPRLVWQDPRGIWFAYISINEAGPNISVSLPTEVVAVPGIRFSYSNTRRRGRGAVLLFDKQFRLKFAREGLTDLPPENPMAR